MRSAAALLLCIPIFSQDGDPNPYLERFIDRFGDLKRPILCDADLDALAESGDAKRLCERVRTEVAFELYRGFMLAAQARRQARAAGGEVHLCV